MFSCSQWLYHTCKSERMSCKEDTRRAIANTATRLCAWSCPGKFPLLAKDKGACFQVCEYVCLWVCLKPNGCTVSASFCTSSDWSQNKFRKMLELVKIYFETSSNLNSLEMLTVKRDSSFLIKENVYIFYKCYHSTAYLDPFHVHVHLYFCLYVLITFCLHFSISYLCVE